MTELVCLRRSSSASIADISCLISQQVEQNLTFDFAMTGSDGKGLEPLFGPSLTGLRNLGNRCASSR
jgi:uncharacterized UBP type Zn finger protein